MRTVAAGVVLLVAAVSGCSSGEAPPAEVAPLASGTGTLTPSDAASERAEVPAEAPGPREAPVVTPSLANPPQTASDFARHYIRLLNEAFIRADATSVRRASHSGCQGCANFIEAIEAPVDDGERVEGGDFVVEYAEAREIAPGDALVDMRYSVEPLRVLDAAGNVIESRPGTPAIDAQLRLSSVKGQWLVRGFRNTSS